MSKYAEMIAAAKGKPGISYSRGELIDLYQAVMNEPELNIPTIVKKGDGYENKANTPGKNIRNALFAPLLRDFGVDKAELSRLDSYKVGRAGAEAVADMATLLTKVYISQNSGLGRKLTLPMLSANETAQSLSTEQVPANTRATTTIVKNEDGTFSTQATGNQVTTAAHEKLHVGNRVPDHLKKTTPVK